MREGDRRVLQIDTLYLRQIWLNIDILGALCLFNLSTNTEFHELHEVIIP